MSSTEVTDRRSDSKAALWILVSLAMAGLIAGSMGQPVGTGSTMPTREPDESQRKYHSFGFSMIAPVDWSCSEESPELAFTGGGRYNTTLYARRLDDDFDDSEFTDLWRYQGAQVPSRYIRIDNGGGPKGRVFIFEFLVTDKQKRYLVGYETRLDISELPGIIEGYLRSFRIGPTAVGR